MANRNWVKSECVLRGKKLKELAAEVGINPAYLSMYIGGYTPLDAKFEGLDEKIRAVLAKWDDNTAEVK